MLDVVTLGETMVLFVPQRVGQLRYASRFDRYIAGAESNLAIGLARIGHSVGWISRVGNDEFGHCILAFLRGEQIDVSQVIVDKEAPTGVFFKERRRSDSTRVFYYRSDSAASRLKPSDLPEDYIAKARYLHLTGITPALSERCKLALYRAIEIAQDAGTRISFDPNIRFKLWSAEQARDVLLDIIPRVQLVLASAEEASLITGEGSPKAAASALLGMGPQQIVVKQGADGVLGMNANEVIQIPSIQVETIETIGAGDAFNAGFLSGQLRGWDLRDTLRLGAVMGALATTAPGDVEGLPDWEEVQQYLDGKQWVER